MSRNGSFLCWFHKSPYLCTRLWNQPETAEMLMIPTSYYYIDIMFKDFMLVGMGSFMGGGLRFCISKWLQVFGPDRFPMGTLGVNIVGCFIIGLLSGLPFNGRILSPTARMVLTTGFCGGFTTFSTFIKENGTLISGRDYHFFIVYLFLSLFLGMAALFAGQHLAKVVA